MENMLVRAPGICSGAGHGTQTEGCRQNSRTRLKLQVWTMAIAKTVM